MSSDFQKLRNRIEDALSAVKVRNQKIQDKKESSSPLAWISAVVLSLISLIGIGLAMWHSRRQGEALAQARTEVELQKMEAQKKEHLANMTTLLSEKKKHIAEARVLRAKAIFQQRDLLALEEAHKKQVARIKGLKSWKDINDG